MALFNNWFRSDAVRKLEEEDAERRWLTKIVMRVVEYLTEDIPQEEMDGYCRKRFKNIACKVVYGEFSPATAARNSYRLWFRLGDPCPNKAISEDGWLRLISLMIKYGYYENQTVMVCVDESLWDGSVTLSRDVLAKDISAESAVAV